LPPAAPLQPSPDEATPVPHPFLLPDLVPVAPDEIYVSYERGEKLLRFSTTIENRGEGTLYLRGEGEMAGGEVPATQVIDHREGGMYERPAGRMIRDEAHRHWHFENFALFELWRHEDNLPAGPVEREHKITFCLIDEARIAPEREDLAAEPRFLECDWRHQGISSGWRETYVASLPGQSLDITSLPNGRYALRTTLDPANLILESDIANNSVTVVLDIEDDDVTVVATS
jgi:hypothetical protein